MPVGTSGVRERLCMLFGELNGVKKCWSGVCTVWILYVRRGVCESGWHCVEFVQNAVGGNNGDSHYI